MRWITDFAIILRRTLKVTKHGTGSIVVNRAMMSLMKVTEDEVWEGAWENLYQEEFSIQDINEAIRLESEGKENGIKPSDFEEMPPMYVLSNKSRDWRARAILRTDLLQKFAEKMGCNLYILPSSVHEVILIHVKIVMRRAGEPYCSSIFNEVKDFYEG